MSVLPAAEWKKPTDRSVVGLLTGQLIGGDTAGVDDIFVLNGLRKPTITWSPATNALPVAQLSFLQDYWRRLPREDDLPHIRSIDPVDMRPALGYIMLVDLCNDGWDFIYRLYGSRVAERCGVDMTGRRASEIDNGNYASIFFLSIYRAVAARRLPIFTEHYPLSKIRPSITVWSRLILPLVGDDGSIVRFLVGIVPSPPPQP
ncbi:MAG: PAS domain-containing protein [Rhodospirillales bacterium]|nr:PAS domain-containing protein [Rhodospirillales bacterium]